MILVTGATGQIGSRVCRQLIHDKAAVRGIGRDRAKAAALEKLGVEMVIGEIDSEETLAKALHGVERAFLLVPPSPGQVAQQARFVQAAKRAGTRHVVKLSGLGVSLNAQVAIERWHAQGERALEESGLAFTQLRPNYFMQNLLMLAPSIIREGVFYGTMGNARLSVIDVQDIAAVAARCLLENGHEGQRYDLTGPELLSFAEMADKLGRALDKPVKYVDVPSEAMRGGMISMGTPEWLADALVGLFTLYRDGLGNAVVDTVSRIGKVRSRTFDEFAADSAAHFGRTS